jgi:lysophospholipase L1-like esterase
MPNITAGQRTGVNIPAGQVLTLVGSSNVTGMLRVFSPDRSGYSQTNVIPGSSSYGPYPADVNAELQCWTGDVTYQVAAQAVPSATAGLPEGVDSNFSGAVVGSAGAGIGAYASARPPVAVAVGDSQLDRTFLTTATETSLVGYGALNHANMGLGQAWDWASGADQAVIGDTCALVLDRMAEIRAMDCDLRFLSLGTNDIWGSLLTGEQTIVGLAQVFDALSDKPLIFIPITPRSFVDVDKVSYALQVNRWAAAQQSVRRNMIVIERAVDAIIDPTSTQFIAASGLLDGAVHWNNAGAVKVGAAIAARLAGLYPGRARMVSFAGDAYPTNNASNQLLPSPVLSGTSGGKTATGGGTAPTGNVAAGFDVDHAAAGTGACACSLVARADGIGGDQRLQISGAAANDRWTFRNTGNITQGVSPGEVLQALGDIRISSHTNLSAISLFIQAQVDGGSINYIHALRNSAADAAYGAGFVGGIQRTIAAALPAGSTITTLQFRIDVRFGSAGGAADVLLGRPNFWNLSR